MRADEDRVSRYLEQHHLTTVRFSKQEMRESKTPDFRVLLDDRVIFFCEVKSSLRDRWLDKQLEAVQPGDLAGGVRNDPIYNRLTSDIHDSVKQFDAVNSRLEYPNVLALVNHDDMCGFNDLIAVVTGNAYTEGGEVLPIYKQYSEGRTKHEIGKIDLFIWLDDFKPERLFFGRSNQEHKSALCEIFGMDEDSILLLDD